MNRENLQKLATFLAYGTAPEGVQFDMSSYSPFNDRYERQLSCGTAGCAVGWAPFAGIEKLPHESFADYCDRQLVEKLADGWNWCFSGYWAHYDNTPLGAAKRIQYFLDNGLPEEFEDEGDINADRLNLYQNIEVKQ